MINFLFFKLFKWKISGNFNLLPKKCVIIVAPHTHWLDFIVCVMVRKIIKVKINFIGKKELFIFPLNIFMKYMGGIASGVFFHNLYEVQILNKRTIFSPEEMLDGL